MVVDWMDWMVERCLVRLYMGGRIQNPAHPDWPHQRRFTNLDSLSMQCRSYCEDRKLISKPRAPPNDLPC